MTSTGNASDKTLTEDAYAPGNSQQGNDQECRATTHYLTRLWKTEGNLRYDDTSRDQFRRAHPLLHPYEADILFWDTLRRQIPEHWCWCLQSHHQDYLVDKQWEATKRYEEYVRHRDNAVEYAKNGRQRGPRELTLTYSPDWYDDDALAQQAFRTAVERLTKYYRDELTEFRAVGEFTKAGRSHVHILYALSNGGKFTDKNLRRAYPHWNPKKGRGGHHSIVKSKSDFSGYLEKDLDDAWCDITYPAPDADDPPQS